MLDKAPGIPASGSWTRRFTCHRAAWPGPNDCGCVGCLQGKAAVFLQRASAGNLTPVRSVLGSSGVVGADGNPEITLNMFDHMGTPMAAEARCARLLGDLKPRFSASASRRLPGGDAQAAGVLFRKTASDVMRLKDGQTAFVITA